MVEKVIYFPWFVIFSDSYVMYRSSSDIAIDRVLLSGSIKTNRCGIRNRTRHWQYDTKTSWKVKEGRSSWNPIVKGVYDILLCIWIFYFCEVFFPWPILGVLILSWFSVRWQNVQLTKSTILKTNSNSTSFKITVKLILSCWLH